MSAALFVLAAVAIGDNALLPTASTEQFTEQSHESRDALDDNTNLVAGKNRDVCICNLLTSADMYPWQRDTVKTRMSVLDVALANVSAYVMFYGYGRSGHSLIGALIDGHPNAILANEYDAVRHYTMMHPEWSREELFRALALNSARCGVYGRLQTNTNYSYPSLWQGSWCNATAGAWPDTLCTPMPVSVIGDKKGGTTSTHFLEHPMEMQSFMYLLRGMPIKMIHVVRNPFDMAATSFFVKRAKLMHADDRSKQCSHMFDAYREYVKRLSSETPERCDVPECSVELAVEAEYMANALRTNTFARYGHIDAGHCVVSVDNVGECAATDNAWIDITYEAFVDRPTAHMNALITFLGLPPSAEYVRVAVAQVDSKRAASRDLIVWPSISVEKVNLAVREMAYEGNGTKAGALESMVKGYLLPRNQPRWTQPLDSAGGLATT